MKSEKITDGGDARGQPERRRYDDACGTAHALDLIGDRWALLVVRELMFGPRRFGEIRAGLPGLSANVLTQRLAELEAAGIVERREKPGRGTGAGAYALTPWGAEIEPVFQTLGRWAVRSPAHDPTRPLSAASLLLSFRTMVNPARAKRLEGVLRLMLDGEPYRVRLAGGVLTAEREPGGVGGGEAPDAAIAGGPTAVAGLIYGGVPLEALEASGALRVEGSRAWLRRFGALFALPPKAPVRSRTLAQALSADDPTPRSGGETATAAQAVDNSA